MEQNSPRTRLTLTRVACTDRARMNSSQPVWLEQQITSLPRLNQISLVMRFAEGKHEEGSSLKKLQLVQFECVALKASVVVSRGNQLTCNTCRLCARQIPNWPFSSSRFKESNVFSGCEGKPFLQLRLAVAWCDAAARQSGRRSGRDFRQPDELRETSLSRKSRQLIRRVARLLGKLLLLFINIIHLNQSALLASQFY